MTRKSTIDRLRNPIGLLGSRRATSTIGKSPPVSPASPPPIVRCTGSRGSPKSAAAIRARRSSITAEGGRPHESRGCRPRLRHSIERTTGCGWKARVSCRQGETSPRHRRLQPAAGRFEGQLDAPTEPSRPAAHLNIRFRCKAGPRAERVHRARTREPPVAALRKAPRRPARLAGVDRGKRARRFPDQGRKSAWSSGHRAAMSTGSLAHVLLMSLLLPTKASAGGRTCRPT